MELVKPIGTEAEFKAEAAGGVLKLSVQYNGKDVSAGAFLQTTPAQVVDALAKLIPGDSVVEQGALAALKLGLQAACS
jgi:hypothetical protein